MASGEKPKRRLPAASYSKDGVDLTLIRWMLSLTPAQRMRVLQASVRSILRMRAASSPT